MKVQLIRTERGDEGTFGVILFDGRYLYTGELPWRDNKSNISCIPTGIHPVRVSLSPRYGRVYQIHVNGRTHVLFHQGNYCGERELGFLSHVRGCVLLGKRKGRLGNQRAVLASRVARREFELAMAFEPFDLEIKDAA